jgi:hypothetical protein
MTSCLKLLFFILSDSIYYRAIVLQMYIKIRLLEFFDLLVIKRAGKCFHVWQLFFYKYTSYKISKLCV